MQCSPGAEGLDSSYPIGVAGVHRLAPPNLIVFLAHRVFSYALSGSCRRYAAASSIMLLRSPRPSSLALRVLVFGDHVDE